MVNPFCFVWRIFTHPSPIFLRKGKKGGKRGQIYFSFHYLRNLRTPASVRNHHYSVLLRLTRKVKNKYVPSSCFSFYRRFGIFEKFILPLALVLTQRRNALATQTTCSHYNLFSPPHYRNQCHTIACIPHAG